ncbi:MAG TPA: DUF952 domain-containing protein [Caulobacteraceae bacterium]|nr:DUF952 domain-containing protein [Caulobacteraceae bacterium]
MTPVYKILPAGEWRAALAVGRFEGSAVDLQDGYIHLSTAQQAQETARRHFHGQADLVLVRLDADALGGAIRWEPSRGGALFPHLYGPLDVAAALDVRALTLGEDGAPLVDAP